MGHDLLLRPRMGLTRSRRLQQRLISARFRVMSGFASLASYLPDDARTLSDPASHLAGLLLLLRPARR